MCSLGLLVPMLSSLLFHSFSFMHPIFLSSHWSVQSGSFQMPLSLPPIYKKTFSTTPRSRHVLISLFFWCWNPGSFKETQDQWWKISQCKYSMWMWRIFFGGSTDCPPQGQGTKGAWDILLPAQISFILRHVPVGGAIVNLAFINFKGWSDSLEH